MGRDDFRKDGVVAGRGSPALEQATGHHSHAVHCHCHRLTIVGQDLYTHIIFAAQGRVNKIFEDMRPRLSQHASLTPFINLIRKQSPHCDQPRADNDIFEIHSGPWKPLLHHPLFCAT